MIDIIEYSKKAYEATKAAGWWNEVHSDKTYLMLIISELGEALNADRNRKSANVEYFKKRMGDIEVSAANVDFNLSFHSGARQTKEEYLKEVFAQKYKAHIKGSIEEELADVALRCLVRIGRDIEQCVADESAVMRYRRVWGNSGDCEDTLIEHLYYVTGRVYFSLESIEGIVDAIVSTFNFCQKQKIDLIWHIDAKMKFNSFCLPKNGGKKY